MSAHILDGKILAAKLKEDLTAQIIALKHATKQVPRIISIIIGGDPASQSYVLSQQRAAQELGIHYELQKLSADVTQSDVLELINTLNVYADAHGIMINKPLPAHLDFKVLINAIAPAKDVEGISLVNLGRLLLGNTKVVPCTAAAALEHIKSTGINIKGKSAVVLGRSEIVGKPIALLLLQEDATVTVCHSKTHDIQGHVRQADIVVAAIGKKHFVSGDWIKPGAIVIDVGINNDQGKITGDMDFLSVSATAGYLTPVPGGVGPVTSVMLMKNAIEVFKNVCLKS